MTRACYSPIFFKKLTLGVVPMIFRNLAGQVDQFLRRRK